MRKTTLYDIINWINGKIISEQDPKFTHKIQVESISTDSRTIKEGDLFFAIKGEHFDGHDFVAEAFKKGASFAVVSQIPQDKEIPFKDRLIFVNDTVTALGKLAKNYRKGLSSTVIAVTGSNGKTTTKELIYHILSKNLKGRRSTGSFNNKIGLPISILEADGKEDFLVLELGTNSPGEIDYLANIAEPNMGVITQISEAHLDGLRDIRQIAAEKTSLIKYIRTGGAAAVNGDNPLIMKFIDRSDISIFTFGRRKENDITVSNIREDIDGIHFLVNGKQSFSLPVLGRHNAYNFLAALIIARRMGFSMESIKDAIKDFSPPNMRMQRIKLSRPNITIINDAYNANPTSMLAAIETIEQLPCKGRRVLCCGDMLELAEKTELYHRKIGKRLGKSKKINCIIAIGSYSGYIAEEALAAGAEKNSVFAFKDTKQASEFIKDFIRENDIILFKGSRRLKLEYIINNILDTIR